MVESLKKIHSDEKPVWITQPQENEELIKRRDKAFQVALGRFLDSNGKIETVMQTAEAFGRGLYADMINEKPDEWTTESWVDTIAKHVLNSMGTGFTFTNISNEEIHSFIHKCPFHEQNNNEQAAASLFTYGFMRGLFKSAFPEGELFMGSVMAKGSPITELTFKSNASFKDRYERERIKKMFTTTKRL